MSEKTITVTLPLESARRYVDDSYNSDDIGAICSAIAAELPPEWAEGTLARVHYWVFGEDDRRVGFAEWRGGKWRHASGLSPYELRNNVTKVEPIRTLGPDEIAVKRTGHPQAAAWRIISIDRRRAGQRDSAALADAYADALEAEARV